MGNNFSLSGGTFSRFTGLGTGGNLYLVYDVYGLQGMEGFLSSTFGLANDVDATVTSNWNSGAGFTPIGNNSTPFTGTFNGNSYTISNLFINLPTTNGVGLFGYTSGAAIENVGLVNANITGQNNVGALVGYNNNSSNIETAMPPAVSAAIKIESAALPVIMLIQAALPTAILPAVSAVVVKSEALLVIAEIQAVSLIAMPPAVSAVEVEVGVSEA